MKLNILFIISFSFVVLLNNVFSSSKYITSFNQNICEKSVVDSTDYLEIDLFNIELLPKWLKECNRIETLYLNNKTNVNENYDISILSEMNSLVNLNIFNFNKIYLRMNKNRFFPSLRLLRIGSCKLVNIPFWIKDLKNLNDLIIYNDSIKSIPGFLINLPKFNSLTLYNTQTEFLSKKIFIKEQLQNLLLSNNNKIDLKRLFRNIDNCKLEYFSIEQCGVTHLPKEIRYLSKVKFLILWRNFLEELPNQMELLDSLRFISLQVNKFKCFPEILTKIPNIDCIELDSNFIQEIPIDLIKKMKKIESISLRGNPIPLHERERISKELPNIKFEF